MSFKEIRYGSYSGYEGFPDTDDSDVVLVRSIGIRSEDDILLLRSADETARLYSSFVVPSSPEDNDADFNLYLIRGDNPIFDDAGRPAYCWTGYVEDIAVLSNNANGRVGNVLHKLGWHTPDIFKPTLPDGYCKTNISEQYFDDGRSLVSDNSINVTKADSEFTLRHLLIMSAFLDAGKRLPILIEIPEHTDESDDATKSDGTEIIDAVYSSALSFFDVVPLSICPAYPFQIGGKHRKSNSYKGKLYHPTIYFTSHKSGIIRSVRKFFDRNPVTKIEVNWNADKYISVDSIETKVSLSAKLYEDVKAVGELFAAVIDGTLSSSVLNPLIELRKPVGYEQLPSLFEKIGATAREILSRYTDDAVGDTAKYNKIILTDSCEENTLVLDDCKVVIIGSEKLDALLKNNRR